MVAVTPVVVARGFMGSLGRSYIAFEASPIDTNDTVPLSELANITDVKCWRLDTGASITATEATNIVTITQAALTDVPIVGLATGY